jgi:hypothetical protein
MRKVLKRWYVWLGLVLLLGLAGSVALICSGRGRITQANFDRIQDGMNSEEVKAILGRPDSTHPEVEFYADFHYWGNEPNYIAVWFLGGKVTGKHMRLSSVWETLQWHAKNGAAKIGIKWE